MIARIAILFTIFSLGAVLVDSTVWLGSLLLLIAFIGSTMLVFGHFLFRDYNITFEGNYEVIVKFNFPLWQRILLLGHVPNLGRIKAEVSYKYEGEERWTFPCNAEWIDEQGSWTFVDGECTNVLRSWNEETNLALPLDDIYHPLPNKFILRIKLIQQRGNKQLATWEQSLNLENGSVTKEGFVPK